ncbi:hypothetical protein H4R26_003394 [Coemansia thaxteri]|uniref:Histone chaperone domain-containing protein n=1 Tax=Coemansia thaxteri TaxID=2663907 RepID=A0A9W8BI62_9FUNG|nr:hypothetical protein H4R26_003394 [Coemansia thaxteri]KAJ2486148.1 hypothetical protein EV174_001301 [Coemansia sp. RSA 2320]
MPAVDVAALKKVCKQVVCEGDLDTLTVRSVRRSAEKLMGLDENALDEKQYKLAVSDTVTKVLASIKAVAASPSGGAGADESEVDDDVEREAALNANAADEEASEESDNADDFSDTAPKKRAAAATNQSPVAAKRAKTAKSGDGKSNNTGGKVSKANESTISNLKQYVVKCGLRKVWSKELAGLDGAQQIQHLKALLEELGMEGRPTLDKCKQIKAKRDLQAELDAIGGDTADLVPASTVRSRRVTARKVAAAPDSEVSDSDNSDGDDNDKEPDAAETTGNANGAQEPEPEDDEEGKEEESESDEESDAYSEDEVEEHEQSEQHEDESPEDERDADMSDGSN